jgi:1-deoxy-D-xylulose-5-phosphate reductoisomerase
MCAIVGIAGLAPTYNAIKASKIVALANKESIVCAGPILKKLAMQYGTKLIPVDSEHSALMQALSGGSISAVKQAIITASGGPFLNRSLKSLADVTPEEAVRHPNWSMGAKISVDSATMMNKVLELIEAQHLFDLHVDQLDVLLHPESIIHGMIEYIDGSVIAQMSMPDMRTSIAVALYYPNHQSISYQPIPWKQLGNLSFAEIDAERFPAINLAKPVMEAGMQAAIVLNAANEEAVQAFLQRKISFTDIFQTVEKALSKYVNQNSSIKNLQEIFALDHQTRAKIRISLGLGQLKSCMVA